MKLDRALRIAFVLPDLRGGGMPLVMLRIASGLLDRGHEVGFVLFNPVFHFPDETPPAARLFVLNNAPDDKTRDRAQGILDRCILWPSEGHGISRLWSYARLLPVGDANILRALPNGRWLRETRYIAAYVAREKPDCVVPTHPRTHIATLWSKSLASSFPPIIPSVHGLWDQKRSMMLRYRFLMQRAKHIVAVSEGVRDEFAVMTKTPRHSISTIYNPVVGPWQDAMQVEVPAHPWMTDTGPPVVLSVGRLSPQKDYPTLLRAFHNVSKTMDLRLIILGEGEQRMRLEALVRELGLQDRVSLPGWTHNVFSFIARASLFVLSSRHEGLPSVLIEALACGCPCVSTDCPHGPSEILEGGRTGPLVPVGDHVSLAEAMRATLRRPPDKERLRARAKFFSVERSVGEYERLIGSACGVLPCKTGGEDVAYSVGR